MPFHRTDFLVDAARLVVDNCEEHNFRHGRRTLREFRLPIIDWAPDDLRGAIQSARRQFGLKGDY